MRLTCSMFGVSYIVCFVMCCVMCKAYVKKASKAPRSFLATKYLASMLTFAKAKRNGSGKLANARLLTTGCQTRKERSLAEMIMGCLVCGTKSTWPTYIPPLFSLSLSLFFYLLFSLSLYYFRLACVVSVYMLFGIDHLQH